MPRKTLALRTDCPYHVTARTNNRDWFQLPLESVWAIFESQLFFVHHAFGIRIHSFVLMSNHFHLLASAPNGHLSAALRWLMTETSREIAYRAKRKNHVYGQRNYKCAVGSYHYFMHAYKYIYPNPVAAKICQRVEQYPFSTLHRKMGLKPLKFPVYPDDLFGDFDRNLAWLNTSVDQKNWITVGRALKKAEFKLRKHKNKKNPLEFELF